MNKTINYGKAFAEILAEALNDTQKKLEQEATMLQKIDEAVKEISEEVKEHGDVSTGSLEIQECRCGCGSVKVEVEFIAFKLLPEGLEVTEGKIGRRIRAN